MATSRNQSNVNLSASLSPSRRTCLFLVARYFLLLKDKVRSLRELKTNTRAKNVKEVFPPHRCNVVGVR